MVEQSVEHLKAEVPVLAQNADKGEDQGGHELTLGEDGAIMGQ